MTTIIHVIDEAELRKLYQKIIDATPELTPPDFEAVAEVLARALIIAFNNAIGEEELISLIAGGLRLSAASKRN